MFVSYQTSIKNQFESLLNHWTDVDNQPQSGGLDPLLGQRFDASGANPRIVLIPATDGSLRKQKSMRSGLQPRAAAISFPFDQHESARQTS